MNIQNKYGFVIGQQVGDMIITDMYRNSEGHLHLIMKCPICGFEKTLRYNRITKIVNHDVHSKPISVKDQYPIGTIINDMTVIGHINENGSVKVMCKCNICGKEKIIEASNIKRNIGTTKHEYCSRAAHGTYSTLQYFSRRLYTEWTHMLDRIYNVNHPSYDNYGGRGLTTDYNDFMDFYNDMGESYYNHVLQYGEKDTTLDRIDNNLGYVKGNIRWATNLEQVINRTNMKKNFLAYSPDGNTYLSNSIKEFAEHHGLDRSGISACLANRQHHTHNWVFCYANLLFLPQNVIFELYY
jgi:hypothetical protein